MCYCSEGTEKPVHWTLIWWQGLSTTSKNSILKILKIGERKEMVTSSCWCNGAGWKQRGSRYGNYMKMYQKE